MGCGFESGKSQKIVITIHHFFHQLSDETSGLGVMCCNTGADNHGFESRSHICRYDAIKKFDFVGWIGTAVPYGDVSFCGSVVPLNITANTGYVIFLLYNVVSSGVKMV